MRGFDKIVGQAEILSRLRALKDFYAGKGVPTGHVLLIGPDGMGKRTIATAFAEECGSDVKVAFARSMEHKGDLTAILTSMEKGEFLVIEEICRLRPALKEMLAPALEDFRIDVVIGQGAGARIHPFILNPFTCVGTCLRETDCPARLKGLFFLKMQTERYSIPELERIAERIATSSRFSISAPVISLIASASAGGPRELEILMRKLVAAGSGEVTEEDARQALSAMGLKRVKAGINIAPKGLDNLSGIEFEEFIGQLLNAMGFRTQMTKASGDGGVDIIAALDKPIVGGRYLFQCKRLAPNSLVGVPTVREFYGAVTADRRASKGVLIATSGFTVHAQEFAEEIGIELIDGKRLNNLLAEYATLEGSREEDGASRDN